MRAILFIALFGMSLPATAAVYSCKDASGRIVYTQTPNGSGCEKNELGAPAIYTSVKPAATAYTYAAAPENSAYEGQTAPSASTANPVDDQRLAAARSRLQEAQKALEEGRKVRYGNERNYAKYLERIAGLEKSVKDAEKQLNDLSSPQP